MYACNKCDWAGDIQSMAPGDPTISCKAYGDRRPVPRLCSRQTSGQRSGEETWQAYEGRLGSEGRATEHLSIARKAYTRSGWSLGIAILALVISAAKLVYDLTKGP